MLHQPNLGLDQRLLAAFVEPGRNHRSGLLPDDAPMEVGLEPGDQVTEAVHVLPDELQVCGLQKQGLNLWSLQEFEIIIKELNPEGRVRDLNTSAR